MPATPVPLDGEPDLPPITVTETDAERLRAMLMTRVALAYRAEACRLSRELRRAKIVAPGSVPSNVVMMSSTVSYEDESTGELKTATLVYPWQSRERSTLSVLSPIGTALLGLRVGDGIEWPLDDASVKRLRILSVR